MGIDSLLGKDSGWREAEALAKEAVGHQLLQEFATIPESREVPPGRCRLTPQDGMARLFEDAADDLVTVSRPIATSLANWSVAVDDTLHWRASWQATGRVARGCRDRGARSTQCDGGKRADAFFSDPSTFVRE